MKNHTRSLYLLFAFLLIGLGLSIPGREARGQGGAPLVGVMNVRGPVAPAMQLYIDRGLTYAADHGFALVVMQLNTPGGSVTTMGEIVERMRASQVPVVVYVSPRGAMAATAGTLITLAGNLSAMAPETTIGAASPVDSSGDDIDTTEATKVKEVLKATARELAADRKPEAIKLAEDMIDNARAVTSVEAVEIGLVDVQAETVSELVAKLDGRKVKAARARTDPQPDGRRSGRNAAIADRRSPAAFHRPQPGLSLPLRRHLGHHHRSFQPGRLGRRLYRARFCCCWPLLAWASCRSTGSGCSSWRWPSSCLSWISRRPPTAR